MTHPRWHQITGRKILHQELIAFLTLLRRNHIGKLSKPRIGVTCDHRNHLMAGLLKLFSGLACQSGFINKKKPCLFPGA